MLLPELLSFHSIVQCPVLVSLMAEKVPQLLLRVFLNVSRPGQAHATGVQNVGYARAAPAGFVRAFFVF